jgi:hypothetical protein
MPQLTRSQPQTLRVTSRHRRLLAVAAVIAAVATSALLVISEQDKAPAGARRRRFRHPLGRCHSRRRLLPHAQPARDSLGQAPGRHSSRRRTRARNAGRRLGPTAAHPLRPPARRGHPRRADLGRPCAPLPGKRYDGGPEEAPGPEAPSAAPLQTFDERPPRAGSPRNAGEVVPIPSAGAADYRAVRKRASVLAQARRSLRTKGRREVAPDRLTRRTRNRRNGASRTFAEFGVCGDTRVRRRDFARIDPDATKRC